MKPKFSEFVHEYTDGHGKTRYAVAQWNEDANQYQRPLDKRSRELTGCHTEYAHKLSDLGGYMTRRQALRRARYLFGED